MKIENRKPGRPPGTKKKKRNRDEIINTSYKGRIGRPPGATGVMTKKKYNFTLSGETADTIQSMSFSIGISKSAVVEKAVINLKMNINKEINNKKNEL